MKKYGNIRLLQICCRSQSPSGEGTALSNWSPRSRKPHNPNEEQLVCEQGWGYDVVYLVAISWIKPFLLQVFTYLLPRLEASLQEGL